MQNNTFFGYYKPSTIIVLDKTSSTNDYSKKLLTNFKPQHPFTAIMAKNQINGRGQRGTTWEAKPNENLTTSYIYIPKNIKIQEQFQITLISSLAIYDVLLQYIPVGLYIKWPNDIMVNNKKIGGILIENRIANSKIASSVIGVGINVFTTQFSELIQHYTTSILKENNDFNLTIIDLVKQIQQKLIHYDMTLQSGQIDTIHKLYTSRLFLKDTLSTFLIDNKKTTGTIKGVDEMGYLLLKTNGTIKQYDLKEIKYLL